MSRIVESLSLSVRMSRVEGRAIQTGVTCSGDIVNIPPFVGDGSTGQITSLNICKGRMVDIGIMRERW